MKQPLLLASLALTLLATGSLAAAETQTAEEMRSSDCARARAAGRMCELTMEAIGVDGDRPSGEGEGISVIKFGTHASLIRLRMDFITEIIRSANEIE